jgi:flagella basal body P-ring formation protein FlgA
MNRLTQIIFLFLTVQVASADVVVPNRTIRANSTINEADLTLKPIANAQAYNRIRDVVGQEARITLYAGRPVLFDDIGPPAVVARNQIVLIEYRSNGLLIATEGRSLQRGGVGDRIRIMNLDSRSTLFGQVQADGTVHVNN